MSAAHFTTVELAPLPTAPAPRAAPPAPVAPQPSIWSNVKSQPVSVTFENISYSVKGKKDTEKQLLHNITGALKPGRLTAIMGASGAGKTTFMNVLSGRITAHRGVTLSGDIKVNGEAAKNMQRIAGYVMQDDIMLPSLTPREHITFAAKMQLPTDLSVEDRESKIAATLRALRLEGCADTRVGEPGLKRGVSGGERKRTSIGVELVSDPKILFLDEPTSGLDSDTAASLIENLQSLAHEAGRTVACTIHQPSSEIFRMFDDIILLANGKLAYYGPANRVVEHFASLGRHCPPATNPCDFLLTELHHAQQADKEVAGAERGQLNTTQLEEAYLRSVIRAQALEPVPNLTHVGKEANTPGPFKQFAYLTQRAFKSYSRNRDATIVKGIQYMFVSLFSGLLFRALGVDAQGVQGRVGTLFAMLMLWSFMPSNGMILMFPIERPVFLREYNKKMYHPLPYYLAKNAVELPLQLLFPLLSSCIGYFLIGYRLDPTNFFRYYLALLLTCQVGTGIGMSVGAAVGNVGKGMELGPSLIIPQMLVAGLFSNINTIPNYFIWLRYISFITWSFSAQMNNEFGGNRPLDCSSIAPNCIGTDVLNFYGINVSWGLSILYLILCVLFWRLLAYTLLHLSAWRAKGRN